MISKAKFAKYALIWLTLALVIVVFLGNVNWWELRRLEAFGVQGPATVIELLPKFHNTIRYEYHVSGKVYRGQMQSWPPNPSMDGLSLGEQLVIYYDPQNPAKSVLGDPGPMLQNETVSVALAGFIMPTFILIAWAVRSSHKKTPRKSSE